MKFWQLVSLMRADADRLTMSRVLRDPRWAQYKVWHDDYPAIVNAQRRDALDAIVPKALVAEVLANSTVMLHVEEGVLRANQTPTTRSMPAQEAWELYGANAVEDALEYGSAQI